MTRASLKSADGKFQHGWVLRTPLDRYYSAAAHRIGGQSRAKEIERFLKFATVGVIGTLVDLFTLNLLQTTIFPPINDLNVAAATSLAFVTAVTSNFTWNRYWTYPDSRSSSMRRQLMQFFFISFVGWIARTVWITFAYEAVGSYTVRFIHLFAADFTPTAHEVSRIGSNIALIIAIGFVMVWNFTANRMWTYRDVK